VTEEPETTRSGRRPGSPDTRGQILDAARAAFAEHGYRGATIRRIARDAGVDPALVHHYFGTKRDLFLAVVRPPSDPGRSVAAIAVHGRAGIGDALVRELLAVWDGPEGERAVALLRSAVAAPGGGRLLEEYLRTQLAEPLVRAVGIPARERPIRVALVVSQLVGLATARYLLRVDWLATASHDAIAGRIGPVIQRYVSEPL